MILGRKKNTEVLYEELLFICQNNSATFLFPCYMLSLGDELLSKSSRLDVNV